MDVGLIAAHRLGQARPPGQDVLRTVSADRVASRDATRQGLGAAAADHGARCLCRR